MILLRAAPRPEPDELLASWVGRLACLYDAPPGALWQELARPAPVRSQPGTGAPTVAELARIAATARLDVGTLIATTVDAMLPTAPSTWLRARVPVLSMVPWCPACLHDDRRRGGVPHLRRLWAVACVAACPRHRRPLTDVCPACAHRMRPSFRWDFACPTLVCAACGADLAGRRSAGPAPARGVLATPPPAAIAAVVRLQGRLLRAAQAHRSATREAGNAVLAPIGAIERLAGHMLVPLGIVPPSRRIEAGMDRDTQRRCAFTKLGVQDVFVVLAALAALLAWPAAEIDNLLECTRRGDWMSAPIPLVPLWAGSSGTAENAVLRRHRRHWPAVAGEVATAVAASLLHDPAMRALQRARQHAATHWPAAGAERRRRPLDRGSPSVVARSRCYHVGPAAHGPAPPRLSGI